jgi:hypothetical protein
MNGERADEPIGDITKGDVVNSLVKVSAKTANRDLKALRMLFKSARHDSAVAEEPTNSLKAFKERGQD